MYSNLFETHKLGSEINPENSLVKLDIDESSKVLLQDLFNKHSFSYGLTGYGSSSLVYTMRKKYGGIIPALKESPFLLKKRRHGKVNYVTEMLMAIGINEQIGELLEKDHHTRIVIPIFANKEVSIVPKISGHHTHLFTNTNLAIMHTFDSIGKAAGYWEGKGADLHMHNIIEGEDGWKYVIDL